MLKHAIQGSPLDPEPFEGNRRRARRGPQPGLRASRHQAASIFVTRRGRRRTGEDFLERIFQVNVMGARGESR